MFMLINVQNTWKVLHDQAGIATKSNKFKRYTRLSEIFVVFFNQKKKFLRNKTNQFGKKYHNDKHGR